MPVGWNVDAKGVDTTDPNDFWKGGAILPLGGGPSTGGYKGYGLSVMIDILAGVLSGAGRPRSHQVSLSAGSGQPINCCDSSSTELACSVCSPCSKRTSCGVPCMRVAFKPAGPDK